MATVAVIFLLIINLLWILTQSWTIKLRSYAQNGRFNKATPVLQSDRASNPEVGVIEAILESHNEATKYSRPVLNMTRPVWVSLGLVLSRVLQFDEKKELLTVIGWNRLVWHDEYLPWNASASGVASVRLPVNKVWTPDIHSYNGYEKTLHEPDVVLSADGLALWVTQKEYGVPCSRNLSPIQWTCRLRVSSTTYDASRLALNSMWHSVDLSSYESHGHVIVSETAADRDDTLWPCCAQPYPSPSIVFRFVIGIQ